MEINKVQWRMIAKGEKLPCDSFLMKKDGTILPLISGAGVVIGQDAYYLPVEELRTLPKEESEDDRMVKFIKNQLFNIKKTITTDYELDVKLTKAINWLEKQGEQKSVDKVEPKFKVSDWFVKNDGSHINKDYDTCKISKVGNGYYTIESIYGYTGKISFETFDTNYHLWTIQDARDGNVLADGNLPFIFKKIDSMMHSYAYCGISVDDGFKIESDGESGEWTWMQDIKPATKEQRDLLFQKMKEAGYEWDAEKKELRKIEQKPAWSEEDEKFFKTALWHISYSISNGKSTDIHCDTTDWFKSLKDRVQPQPKQEWSEEDINLREATIGLLNLIHPIDAKSWGKSRLDCIDWLKSLRPQSQWKPSKEQMTALKDVLNDAIWQYDHKGSLIKEEVTRKHAETIESLYNDLKKLK